MPDNLGWAEDPLRTTCYKPRHKALWGRSPPSRGGTSSSTRCGSRGGARIGSSSSLPLFDGASNVGGNGADDVCAMNTSCSSFFASRLRGTAEAQDALWRRQGRFFLTETESHPEDRAALRSSGAQSVPSSVAVAPPTPARLCSSASPNAASKVAVDVRGDGVMRGLLHDGRGWSIAQRRQAGLYGENRDLLRRDGLVIAEAAAENAALGALPPPYAPVPRLWSQRVYTGHRTAYSESSRADDGQGGDMLDALNRRLNCVRACKAG